MIARGILVIVGMGYWLLTAMDLYIWTPQKVAEAGILKPAPDIAITALLIPGAIWLVVFLVAMSVLVSRLGARATWSGNGPFSLWRSTRSCALLVGIVGVSAVIPNIGMLSYYPDADTSVGLGVAPAFNYALVSTILLAIALVMFIVGAAARLILRDESKNRAV